MRKDNNKIMNSYIFLQKKLRPPPPVVNSGIGRGAKPVFIVGGGAGAIVSKFINMCNFVQSCTTQKTFIFPRLM